jgi:peptidoglycan/LPS O-acetylase OafA/YrhL
VLGQRSYEIYLTHMFLVFALFELFIEAGKPLWGAPLLFGAVILGAGVIGALTARLYSEPMNRLLRARWQRAPAAVDAALAESAIEG